jgi:hypothetical protein
MYTRKVFWIALALMAMTAGTPVGAEAGLRGCMVSCYDGGGEPDGVVTCEKRCWSLSDHTNSRRNGGVAVTAPPVQDVRVPDVQALECGIRRTAYTVVETGYGE